MDGQAQATRAATQAESRVVVRRDLQAVLNLLLVTALAAVGAAWLLVKVL